jgi:diaminohydroxyphosphoribosylaminopyrimidine deaminase/5-amino-6-(5-phosphoribosylamino)uracil reductase
MHEHYLMMALAKARQRCGFCFPNPAVGAVIVHQGELVAEENHYSCGLPHAEQNAIEAFSQQGLTPDETTILYVSLEPCNHWGKTPPCTSAIIDSGIKKVIYAYKDPNPLVSEKDTAQLLQDKGIVCLQVKVEAIDKFYQPYHYWMKTGKPFVTYKVAQSLDGKIAKAGGVPYPISQEPLTTFTHEQRLAADAILSTARTIKNDNARLNVRLADKTVAKPVVILDGNLTLTGQEAVFQSASKVYLLHSDALTPQTQFEKTEYIARPLQNGRFLMSDVLSYLGKEAGIHHLFIEAGGTFFSSCLMERCINRAYLYLVPIFLGCNGVSVFNQDEGLSLAEQAVISSQRYGNQWLYQCDFIREAQCLQE